MKHYYWQLNHQLQLTMENVHLIANVWLEAGVGRDIKQGAGSEDDLLGSGSFHTFLYFTHTKMEYNLKNEKQPQKKGRRFQPF